MVVIFSYLFLVLSFIFSFTSSTPINFEFVKSWSVTCKTDKSKVILYEVKQNLRNNFVNNETEITISDCPPPEKSYADILTQNNFDVNLLKILKLRNIKVQKGTPLQEKHFVGLPIKKLRLLFNINQISETVDQNILNVLPMLTTLYVSGVKMPPIPSHLKIVEAGFSTGLFSDGIGACSELQSLTLSSWDVRVEHLLESCSRLTNLGLARLSDGTAARVIRSAKFLTKLSIQHGGLSISDYDDISFDHLVDLVKLDLSNNFLPDLRLIRSLPLLQELYLNDNMITAKSPEIVDFYKRLPQLRTLGVSNNLEFDFCTNKSLDHNLLEIMHPHLRRLTLRRTATSLSCLGAEVFPSLEYLDLRNHDILVIQELQISKVALRVNLWENFLTEVNFTEIDYSFVQTKQKSSTKNTTVYLDGSMGLDCDCQHGWFADALRENLVIAPNAHCKYDWDETHLTQISPDQLKCDKFSCSGCTCRRYWTNSSVEANCTDAKVNEIPKVKGLSKLTAQFNRIVLRKNDIPDSLLFLDLRSNEILHVEEEVTKTLFSLPKRQILLSGNPILCDCENLVFIKYLQEFSKQVADYEDVKCARNGTAISDVILGELCQINGNLQAALISGGAVLILALIIMVFYWRYGSAIHMFLYARGLLCCVDEDKLDADRLYDAFVSYCYTDESAAEEIVSWLEQRDFKVCVHYRDWIPGEMIPTQIVRSVEVSRRTVILLSKNFTESLWGLLEFRTAHSRALKEGVMRVILVVIDDVIDDVSLDDDLRRYIRLNTYVRYDDPWFWDKLYYAMPKRRGPDASIELSTVQNREPVVPAITYEPSQSALDVPENPSQSYSVEYEVSRSHE